MKLKLTKCQIMTDRKDMEGVKEIYGIELKDKIKYLCVNLFCDRQKTVQSMKDQTKKYMSYLKGRVRTQNTSLMHVIFQAFYRLLLIYFMVPLFAAGAITEKEIQMYEAQLIRE